MMTQQRLTRSSDDKMIGGVCGGLARYFGIDVVVVRLVMVALVFAGGVSVLLYPILWLVMPAEGAVQPQLGESWHDFQRRVQAMGQPVSETSAPRFDPQTGQPIAATNEGRNRVLGMVLLGLGLMMLASMFGGGELALALMVLAGGVYLLRRAR